MINKPLVSIIIPTCNRAHLIGETLDSVLAQTYTNWECIVVDDGSMDETIALMKSYCDKDARFQYHHRPNNRLPGGNAARNYGFELSKGLYVSFVDSDDLISKRFVEKRCEFFKLTNCDFVVANTGQFIDGKKINNLVNKDPQAKTVKTYLSMFLAYQLPWTIMSVTWKREILKKHRFDENLQRLQDVDLHIRILSEEYQLIRLDEFDNYYRVDPQKSTDTHYIHTVIENFCELFKKLLFKRYYLIYPKEIKSFGFYFLLNFILPNIIDCRVQFNKIYKLLDKKELINNKEKAILNLLKNLNIKLGNRKGIGVYRLNKYLKLLLTS